MKSLVLSFALLASVPMGSCQSSKSAPTDASKAAKYYADGVECFNRLDVVCSMTLLEQVWYLDDFSEVDVTKWTYYTAESNYLVAIDENALYPQDKKIASAERAEALFQLLGSDFDERRLLLQYFLIRTIEDPCDIKRINAIERFNETSAATNDRTSLDKIKSLTRELIQDDSSC